jgi:hypothetical protein
MRNISHIIYQLLLVWSTEGGYLLTYGAELFLEGANCAVIQEIPNNFKESKGSSPCLQEPSTGPYPEPVWSSPYHPILSL